MTFVINHHMLRLKISEDNQLAMKVLKCANDLCCIELHITLDFEFVDPQPTHQITTLDHLHLYVDILLILERRVCLYQEWIVVLLFANLHEYVTLTDHLVCLLPCLDLFLVHYLEHVLLSILLLHHSVNYTECTMAYSAYDVEMVEVC